MANKKPLRIGLIGCGFMGRTHSNGYNRIRNFFPELQYEPQLKAVCSRNPDKVKAFAEQWGYESFETDWRKLVERDDIDAVDICTPNDTHAEIAIAAAAKGKMILCEKPLARTVAEGQKMVDGITIAEFRPSRLQSKSSTQASSARYFTSAQTFFRTGPSAPIFHREEQEHGAWTLMRRGQG
jgi:hypothetical protein